MNHDEFVSEVVRRGHELYRDMPWRTSPTPYYVLVSEVMLQQTQAPRVIPKFESFVLTFPNIKALAEASLADVLREWQGLGYNRRAKYLHETAKAIVAKGKFPRTRAELVSLPGIGENTAGAILAYAYNLPELFIETNIRSVYIAHFFAKKHEVDDSEIRELLKQTIDDKHPREFYWALMDYGTWLKKQGVGPGRSRHYKKQTPLKGSIREVRGQIVRALSRGDLTQDSLYKKIEADHRFDGALTGLIKDKLVTRTGNKLHLTK